MLFVFLCVLVLLIADGVGRVVVLSVVSAVGVVLLCCCC